MTLREQFLSWLKTAKPEEIKEVTGFEQSEIVKGKSVNLSAFEHWIEKAWVVLRGQKENAEPQRVERITAEWEGRDLCVLFPCYKTTNPATAWALVALALDLGKERARFDMEMGDAMIVNTRNKLADRFLASGCKWSLWLDDDVIPPIGRAEWFRRTCYAEGMPDEIAGRHVVNRLIGSGKTIIGGTYWGRRKGSPPMSSVLEDATAVRSVRSMPDRVMPVDWVATGCLLVHRDVYLGIKEKFPELAPEGKRKEWDFFRKESDSGEDVAFCHRAKEAGHQPFMDAGLQCAHVGYIPWGAWNT